MKGWMCSPFCNFCNSLETVDHIFLYCYAHRTFWVQFNLYNPWGCLLDLSSVNNLWDSMEILPRDDKLSIQSLFCAYIWVIWTNRNKVIFNDIIGLTYNNLCFNIFSLYFDWTGSRFGMEQQFQLNTGGSSVVIQELE